MEHHLSIEESLRFGWAKTRAHSTIIFQVLLTLFALQIAEQIVARVLGNTFEGGVASVVLFILGTMLGIGFTLITLRIAQGAHVVYADILPALSVCLPYIGAAILSGIVMVAPLIVALLVGMLAYALLPTAAAFVVIAIVAAIGVVAAMYFALRYSFVRFAILDDKDMTKSLRTSAHLSQGRKWWLVGFAITICLINLLGMLLLLVGLLVTIPVTMFAFAHVYVKLHTLHHPQ